MRIEETVMLADLSVPKRVVLAGVVLATLETLSNLLAVPFWKLTHSLNALLAYANATSMVQIVGLFVALVGGIMFAHSEPWNRLAWWALFVAIMSFASVELMTRNLMHRTAVVVPIFYFGEMTALSMLLISALRLIRTGRSPSSKLTENFLTDVLTHFVFSEDGTDRVLQTWAFFGFAWGPSTTTTTPVETPTSI